MTVANWQNLRLTGFSFRHDALGSNWTILNTGADATALPTFTSGEALEVVSSNAADGIGGNGARTIQAIYLDIDSSLDSATITMNGTAAVAFADTTIARILDMHVMTYGASGPSFGNITVRKVGGANRMQIQAGFSRAAPGRRSVPNAYAEFYKGFMLTGGGFTTSGLIEFKIVADIDPATGSLNEGVFQEIAWAWYAPNSGHIGDSPQYAPYGGPRKLELPAKSTIMAMARCTVGAVTPASIAGYVYTERMLITN